MRIGIIGCGKQAQKHVKGLLANNINDFVFYDIEAKQARSTAAMYGGSVVGNVIELFEDDTIHAIDICTPITAHKTLILQAIDSNKSYFCEKPLTTSVEDAQLFYQLTKEKNLFGMIGYIYRLAPALREIKTILAKGILGEIHTGLFRIGGRGNHAVWKHQKSTMGGALNEMAVHMIDLAVWYMGDIKSAQLLDARHYLPTRVIEGGIRSCDADDYVHAKLGLKNNASIVLLADFLSAEFNQYIELHGSNGSIKASIDPHYDNQLLLHMDKGSYKKGKNKLGTSPLFDLYPAQMKMFIDGVYGCRDPLESTLSDSVKVTKIHHLLQSQLSTNSYLTTEV